MDRHHVSPRLDRATERPFHRAGLTTAEIYPAGRPEVAVHFIQLPGGVRLRVAESGDRHAPAVLLLHGWGGSLFSFRHAFELLPAAGFRAIACDLRGFGLSDKPRGDPQLEYRRDDFRSDLVALVEHLELGSARLSLIGHSLGGGIALDTAMHVGQRLDRLVLINPVGFEFPDSVWLARIMPRGLVDVLGPRAVPRGVVAGILRYVAFGDASAVTEDVVDQYWMPTQLAGFVGAAHAAAAQYDWRPFSREALARVTNPALVIVGRHDRVVHGGAAAERLLPNARVVAFDGGHCVHEEQPAVVWPIVTDFLADGVRKAT